MKAHRIWAVLLRHILDTKHNWFRIVDIVFWPMVDLLLWGFLTLFLIQTNTTLAPLISMILGAIILWSLFFRIEQEIAFCFMSEIWEKNILNLFASPLTFKEYFAGAMILAFGKLLFSIVVLSASAYFFYNYNFFSVGWVLVLLLGNLLFHGMILGILAVSIILRFGTRAEYIAWWLPFLIQPFSVVTIPLHLLPQWMQNIAVWVPTSHVFEGLRTVVIDHQIPTQQLIWASLLNIVYFVVAVAIFSYVFKYVKENGLFAKYN